jgi:DNA-binding SARP family transcriptional activator
MVAPNDWMPDWSIQDRRLVRTVTELLDAGEYERLAEFLERARLSHDREVDPISAQTLDLARRICLACSQSQAEAEWHQQARSEATQREEKLRQQLNALLDLGDGRERSPDAPSAPEPLGLRQRIVDLLHWRPGYLGAGIPPAPSPQVEAPRRPAGEAAPIPRAEPDKKQEAGPPSLIVYCLGQFRVYQDDRLTTDWPSGKGKSIFKYMIANRQRPIAKDVLMDLFWRGANPDAARNNLNVAIYGLRQALRAGRPDFSHILFQDDHYLLNPSMSLWIDAEEFLAHCEHGRRLEKEERPAPAVAEYEVAEGLYQGDFLEEDPYEDWPMLQREGLRDSYLVILERLSRHYLESQRYAMCIHLCQKILAKDDCREDAHRRLMRCYCRQGQPYLALRQYHLCAETLQKELEVPPMVETLALYERIRTGAAV